MSWEGESWDEEVPPSVGVALPVDFQGFHELYAVPYLRYAYLHLGSRREAEHLVGCVFVELALHWPYVKQQETSEGFGWEVLKQLVGERLQELGRGSALVEMASFSAALRAPRGQFEVLESKMGLYAAIWRLPERQSDVMVLRYLLGYPEAWAARLLGITGAAVRSHVRHAKRRLIVELGIAQTAKGDGE